MGPKKRSHRSTRSLDSPCSGTLVVESSVSDSEEDFEVIGYDRVVVKSVVDLPTVAESSIRAALNNATISQVGERLVYGNSLGYQVLQEIEESRERMRTLQAMVTAGTERTRSLEEKVSQHHTQIQRLTAACEGYLAIRQRFLDTFRRDILNDPSAESTPAIRLGNAAAHNGDAATDATLFTKGRRADESLMVMLYGLTAEQVLLLSQAGDDDSISVLNARASLKANKERPIPQEIEDVWATYVSNLEQNLGQSPRKDYNSAFGQAYWRFWDVYHKYKY